MKKLLISVVATVLLLAFSSNSAILATETTEHSVDITESDILYEKYVEGTGFKIDPSLDLSTDEYVDVIVEFNALAPVMAQKYQARGARVYSDSEIDQMHADFQDYVNDNSSLSQTFRTASDEKSWIVSYTYSDIFVGVSMSLPGRDIEILSEAEQVLRIWPDETVTVDPIQFEETTTRSIDTSSRMINTISTLGIDVLHNEGIDGSGIKVGVLDTGIDYNHPDLTSAYYGYRYVSDDDLAVQTEDTVIGWDYVDNDADPMETTYHDWTLTDKLESVNGRKYWTSHGTHVSGTIAGTAENTGSEYATKGVAPNAQLYGYRVLGPYGSGVASWIIGGIEKSVTDGMDIINLSLGNSYSNDLYPTSLALNNAALSGVVPVVAAGNDGPFFNTVGSPGSSALSITVGASNLDREYIEGISVVNGVEYTTLQMANNFEDGLAQLEDNTFDIIYAGLGEAMDYISRGGTTDDNPSNPFKDKIVLIERGTISFHEKITRAKLFGASGVVIYNNIPGVIEHDLALNNEYLPTLKLTDVDGNELLNSLNQTTHPLSGVVMATGEITFTDFEDKIEYRNDLASLSSVGPIISNGAIKPDLVAPGVDVLSAYPADVVANATSDDYTFAYAQISGTSMATPHVAGVAALMLQNNSSLTVDQVKAILTNTADELNHDYSVFQTGGGRLSPYDAVHSDYNIYVENKYRTYNEDMVIVESDNRSGVIDYGIVFDTGEAHQITKTIVLEKINNVNTDLSLAIEYTDSAIDDLIQDSVSNGVSVVLSNSNLASTVEATITVSADASNGLYEGRIIVTNANDTSDVRYIPFATYKKEAGIYDMDIYPPLISAGCHDYPLAKASLAMDFGQPITELTVYYNKDGVRQGIMKAYDYGSLPVLPVGPIEIINTEDPIGAQYIPFDDSGEGLANYVDIINPGPANIEVEAVFDDGSKDSIMKTVLVSNEQPVFEQVSGPSKLYEYENTEFGSFFDQKTVEASYKVIEPNLEWLQDNSNHTLYYADYSNSRNFIEIYTLNGGVVLPSGNGVFVGDDDGVITLGFERRDALSGDTYLMNAYSRYSGCNTKEYESSVAFTSKDTPEAYGRFMLDKDSYEPEEDVIGTYKYFNLENAQDFYMRRLRVGDGITGTTDVKEYRFTEEFLQFQEDNNVEYEIIDRINEYDQSLGTEINLVSAPSNYEGITGDMGVLEIVYNAVDSQKTTINKMVGNLAITAHYTKINETNSSNITHYGVDLAYKDLENAYTYLLPIPEAFTTKNDDGTFTISYPAENGEMESLGIEYTYESVKGKITAPLTSAQQAVFDFKPSDKLEEVHVNVPGHTTEVIKYRNGAYENGRIIAFEEGFYGRGIYDYDEYGSYAGDVNGDEVIDVYDMASLYKVMSDTQTDLSADINLDGSVDITDIQYIINNIGVEGELATTDAVLISEKYKDIHYYINMLGENYQNYTNRSYESLFEDDYLTDSIVSKLGVNLDDEVDYDLLDNITSIDSNEESMYSKVTALGGINLLNNLDNITINDGSLSTINITDEFKNLNISTVDLSYNSIDEFNGNKLANLTTVNIANNSLNQFPVYFEQYDQLDLNIDGNNIIDFSALGNLDYKVNVGEQTTSVDATVRYDIDGDTIQNVEFELPVIIDSQGRQVNHEDAFVDNSVVVSRNNTFMNTSKCTVTNNIASCEINGTSGIKELNLTFSDSQSTTGNINVKVSANLSVNEYSSVLAQTGYYHAALIVLFAFLLTIIIKKFNKIR